MFCSVVKKEFKLGMPVHAAHLCFLLAAFEIVYSAGASELVRIAIYLSRISE